MRFDLLNLRSLPVARAQLRLRWAGLGFLIVFPALGVAGIGYGLYTHSGLSGWVPSFGLLVGITAMFSAFGALFMTSSRCLANSLEVSSQGFKFDFGGGHLWWRNWSDPALRLQAARLVRGDGTWAYVLVSEGPFRRAFVTPEAYAELTMQARECGLQMSERPSQRSPALVLATITR